MAKKKILLRLNENVIDMYDLHFQRNLKTNTFYEKRIFVSRNISENINPVYQMFGDLGGFPMNEWEDEKKLTDIFIISETDYNFLKLGQISEDVAYIQKLINNQQTFVDQDEFRLTSKLQIVRFSTFKKYCEDRKDGTFQQLNSDTELDFQKEIYNFYFKE